MPNAADSLPSSAAVGWASPRSSLVIIALDTPERSASALTERSRAARAACRAEARDSDSASVMLVTIAPLMATIVTMKVRDASELDAEACAAIYAPYVTDTTI